MFTRVLCCVALFATLALLVPSAHAEIMHEGARTDLAWQQEYVALGQQYTSVGAFYGYDGSKWWNAGSGVVISDHHVLASAHQAHYSNYCFVTGNHITNDAWGGYYTTGVTVNPQYTGIGSTDLAIWTFSDTLTSDKVSAARLYTGDDSALVGSVLDFAGFGYYGYPSTGVIELDGAKRGSQNILGQLGYPSLGYGGDQLVTSFAPPGSSEYQRLGGIGAGGDSGGGWFIPGTTTLVGVSDWVTVPLDYNAVWGATSVSQHMDWVQSVSGVPEPGTIVMFGSGAAAFIFLSWRRRRKC